MLDLVVTSVPRQSASCVQAPRLASQLCPGREGRYKQDQPESTGDVNVKTEMIDKQPLIKTKPDVNGKPNNA